MSVSKVIPVHLKNRSSYDGNMVSFHIKNVALPFLTGKL